MKNDINLKANSHKNGVMKTETANDFKGTIIKLVKYFSKYKISLFFVIVFAILSTVFNIFNIDIYRPVLVTEGPFDAFLLPNCIATSGASKSIGIDLPFWFVYDSDKTGNEHAMKMLQEGYNVFMWEKLKKDLGLPDKNPYSSNKLKWDINDVIKWCRDNNYKQTIYWSKYFSNDMLDGLDI